MEITILLSRMDQLSNELQAFKEEFGARLSEIEHEALERRGRIEGRKDIIRLGLVLYRSDLARWAGVLALAWLLQAR